MRARRSTTGFARRAALAAACVALFENALFAAAHQINPVRRRALLVDAAADQQQWELGSGEAWGHSEEAYGLWKQEFQSLLSSLTGMSTVDVQEIGLLDHFEQSFGSSETEPGIVLVGSGGPEMAEEEEATPVAAEDEVGVGATILLDVEAEPSETFRLDDSSGGGEKEEE